jgi:hypothetical protein
MDDKVRLFFVGGLYFDAVALILLGYKKQARQKRSYTGHKNSSSAGKISAISSQLLTKNYGNILLFEKTVETTGLGNILQSCFNADYQRDIGTVLL